MQGIHTLLNNCPRLTHLSLTGVQAFLRDDLTVFCREAPSEFNDHQREVFCVFSGTGVARLREYLNGGGTNTPLETGIVDSEDDDGEAPPPPAHRQGPNQNPMPWPHGDNDEDEDMEDDETPVEGNAAGHDFVSMHMHSTSGNENVQMITSPHGLGLTHAAFLTQQQARARTHSWDGVGGAVWANGPSYSVPIPSSHGSSPGPVASGSANRTVIANGSGASPPGARDAQHVTGMMGAVNMVDPDETR